MAQNKEKAVNSKFNQQQTLYCKYCGKECKSINSLKQHECRCPSNENRKSDVTKGFNTPGITPWNKGLTKETDERVLKSS